MQCFVVLNDEIEGRLDVFYYLPEFVESERRIKKSSSKTLGDYIINISGGATPEKDESEKYYTDSAENGVPFLRVQNITESGLYLADCKYINFDTHNGMLKRSQVKEGYLITKITGVGRMAVSSVAPDDFEGNINQHLVAIKTDSYQTSEVLAAFLNSDIGERLAFRRSTGGTRPALDYQALKTIPVVFKTEIVEIMQSAYSQKKQMEAEAQRLLDSIDDYVLDELGIKLPEFENKMFFIVDVEEINERFNAEYHDPFYTKFYKSLPDGKYKLVEIKDVATAVFQGVGRNITDNPKYTLLKVKNIKQNNEVDYGDVEFVKDVMKSKVLNIGDIISPFIGEAVRQCKFSVFNKGNGLFVVDNNTGVIRIDSKKANCEYIAVVLNSQIGNIQLEHLIGGGGVPFLGANNAKKLKVPLPPLEIQNKIAEEVKRRISEAERLKAEASEIINKAKQRVEEIILRE